VVLVRMRLLLVDFSVKSCCGSRVALCMASVSGMWKKYNYTPHKHDCFHRRWSWKVPYVKKET